MIDKLERLCDAAKPEGEWLRQLDMVEGGEGIEVKDMGKVRWWLLGWWVRFVVVVVVAIVVVVGQQSVYCLLFALGFACVKSWGQHEAAAV